MYTEIVVIGILLAVIYFEVTELSPGGLVTPVYLALCLTSPLRIAYTLLIVLASYGIVRLLGRFWILFGKRLFAVTVIVSFLLSLLLEGSGVFPVGIRMIGYVVPALIVRDLGRQGFAKTGLSMGIVTALCALVLLWMGVL